ncbi:hypothetical protein HD806DRAFT_424704 [Xylariaceae sp. AK1471]|nr:hypothetical protein HD806DRAFT_424704 [Xylariaceae sp. AK1471]
MRSAILVLATSSCAHAAWLRWSVNREAVWAAQETGHVTESDLVGWTPIPTPAPGVRKDSEVVLDLLLKRASTETDWTNSETCGWFSGISSSAVMCGNNFTCATNSDHVVACASGTFSPFYTACLDYSAFQAGSCSSLDAATGCCQQETEPACGTYLWTGSPERSMYKCFETASIVSILDVPQFVIDASIFSKTHTTPTPTTTPSSNTATDGSGSGSGSSPDNTGSGGSDPSSGTAAPGSGSGSGSGSTTATPTPGQNNTPIIVGSVVGGIAGLLFLLLLLLFCLRRKTKGKLGLGFTRNKKSKKEDNSSKAYHTMNVNAAAAKGRNSSGSEATAGAPIPLQQQPQHHYYNQEQNHYHPQAPQQQQQQAPPQYQGPAGGQQPISISHTVNEGTTHVRQPSYSHTSYTTTTAPATSSAPSQFIVGGIVPMPHHSGDQQKQSQQQQMQQQPQQTVPPQLQPVNHIHVYYAPPMHHTETSASSTQFSSPSPDAQMRGSSGGSVPDALGLFTHTQPQPHEQNQGQDHSQSQQAREQDQYQGHTYGHNRDVSGASSISRRRSPSPDLDAEWRGAGGPGYRQSM